MAAAQGRDLQAQGRARQAHSAVRRQDAVRQLERHDGLGVPARRRGARSAGMQHARAQGARPDLDGGVGRGTGIGHVIGRAEPRGLLDDNVQAAAGFLDAYEATADAAWIERAVTVMRYCGRAHWDETGGGFFDVARDRTGAAYLATPAKPVQDSPTPSANGVAALVLARLWAHTDDQEWRRLLDRQLEAFAGGAGQLSLYGATLLRAMDWALNPVTRIEISGPRGEGPACAMHLLALQTYRPRRVVVRKTADRPAATVCVGTTCSLPVRTPEALGDLLR